MATTEEDEEERSMKLTATLDVDLDEIDDKEFDIPRIDKPPTLESILNAPDDDLPLADNCVLDGTLQVCATPTDCIIIRSCYTQDGPATNCYTQDRPENSQNHFTCMTEVLRGLHAGLDCIMSIQHVFYS